MIVAAIHKLLSESPQIAPYLGTIDIGGKVLPCVFTTEEPPAGAIAPYITVVDSASAPWGRTRGKTGGQFLIAITLTGNRGDSLKGLRSLAQKIWRLMDRCTLDFTANDYSFCGAISDPPIKVTQLDFPGYTINVQIRVRERKA